MARLPLPHPYLPGDQKADSFEDRAQQNMDAIAIAVGNLRENTSWSRRPQVRVYNNAAHTIANDTSVALTYNTEHYDLGTTTEQHSTSSNTSRLTCRTPGLHRGVAYVEWGANSTGYRMVTIHINGGDPISRQRIAAVNLATHALPWESRLAAGDYVEVFVRQTSGGSLDVNRVANISPEFSMHWVSP